MSRIHKRSKSMLRITAALTVGTMAFGSAVLVTTTAAGAAVVASLSPKAKSWCSAYGSHFMTWSGTSPNLAICGPGPAYGGAWDLVSLPGPGGTIGGYFNGTPGFQCVELAERYLAVAYGFQPTNAEGASVAANYHAEYPHSTLIVDGSKSAVHHAPVKGDVISFSLSSSFHWGDGHVAIVVSSKVDQSTGNGTVTVAQQNVSSSDYIYNINLRNWKLSDPQEPGNAEFQFPDAEWLHVLPTTTTHGPSVFITPHATTTTTPVKLNAFRS